MGLFDSLKTGAKNLTQQTTTFIEKSIAEANENAAIERERERVRQLQNIETNRKTALYDAASADRKYQTLMKKSYTLHEKIEETYSIVRSLNAFNEAAGDQLLDFCEEYFSMVQKLKPFWEKYEVGIMYADPYKRASMVYENRKDYANAALICMRSIHDGLPNDGQTTTMRSRLARMIKKGGLIPTEEMERVLLEAFD